MAIVTGPCGDQDAKFKMQRGRSKQVRKLEDDVRELKILDATAQGGERQDRPISISKSIDGTNSLVRPQLIFSAACL